MKKIFISLVILTLSGLLVSAAKPTAAARWVQTAETKDNSEWKTGAALHATEGKGICSFVGAHPTLEFKGNSVTVANFDEGDYFLFSLKVGKLPKRSQVDFAVTMLVIDSGAPEKWVCEILDGKKWRSDDKAESFTVKHYDKVGNPSTYMHSFTLKKPCKGEVKVRVRCMDASVNPETFVALYDKPWISAYLAAYDKPAHNVTKAVLLGNSFTFFGGSYIALHEIAMSQGHRIDMNINLKGGQTFGQHLKLERSMQAVDAGGYQVALLQNLSRSASMYATDREKNADILRDAVTLAERVRAASPECRVILERTWAFLGKQGNWLGFGNAEAFDNALSTGAREIAAAMGADLSPIGEAFAIGREMGLKLYSADNFHQNFLGSYLKACVNYLVLFGEPFTSEVSDFWIPAEEAAKCRDIASKVVLK